MSPTCLHATCQPSPSSSLTVGLRTLRHGDQASLLEIFTGLGDRSRELRFLTPKPRLTPADLRQLTAVDHHDHVALLAVTADERPIGVARFVRDPREPDIADVAVAVVDDWHGRGVGTLLASALTERALHVGVRRFSMVMRPDNEAAVRLLHRAPGKVSRVSIDSEAAEFVLHLEQDGRKR